MNEKREQWISVKDFLPIDIDDWQGHSVDVLIATKTRIFCGYLIRYYEGDVVEDMAWKMLGPDSYTIEDVTHWMYQV